MGDRCDIRFRLSGKITKAQAEKLIELMKAEHLTVDDFDEAQEPALHNLAEEFEAEDVNYGLIKGVTDYCITEKIAYDLWNSAGGSYGPGLERFDGIGLASCNTDETGEPMFPLSEVLATDNLATCFGPILKRARHLCRPLPDVEIVP